MVEVGVAGWNLSLGDVREELRPRGVQPIRLMNPRKEVSSLISNAWDMAYESRAVRTIPKVESEFSRNKTRTFTPSSAVECESATAWPGVSVGKSKNAPRAGRPTPPLGAPGS